MVGKDTTITHNGTLGNVNTSHGQQVTLKPDWGNRMFRMRPRTGGSRIPYQDLLGSGSAKLSVL